MNATPQQVKAIQIARRNTPGMDDATYRDLVFEVSSGLTTSSTKLTMEQASSLLNIFKGFGFTLKTKPTPPPIPDNANVVGMITPRQRALINHLVAEIRWHTPEGYENWLHAKMRLSVVATRAQASRVIEGLKGLKEHGHAMLQTQ